MKKVLTALVCVIALGTLASGQQGQFFRSSTQTVPIYATVVDSKGRLVPDLTQADFEVLDNAKPAPLTNFVAEVLPISVVVALDLSGSPHGKPLQSGADCGRIRKLALAHHADQAEHVRGPDRGARAVPSGPTR